MAAQLGPHELLHVFSFLEARDLLLAAQVNKVWNEVSMTKELWRQLCLRRWASCGAFPVVLGTQTWRQYYFCRSELEFRVESGRPRDFISKAISGHAGKIDQLAYVSPHEYRFDEMARSVVCTVSSDCTVRAWDLHQGTEIWSSPVQPAPLVSLVAYPLLQLVVTVDTQGLIIGWKADTGSEWASFCLPTSCSSMEACGHPEGPFLMVACADGNLYTLTVPQLQVVSKVATFPRTSVSLTCSPDQQWVSVLAQGSDVGPKGHGSQVILLASRSELVLFTIQGLQLVAFRDHQRPITSMWVDPNRVVTSSLDLSLRVYVWDKKKTCPVLRSCYQLLGGSHRWASGFTHVKSDSMSIAGIEARSNGTSILRSYCFKVQLS
ncbi:F-box/WD repeat-containing protein 12 [Cricetulus griseus]|uniref:F-box/WD repeat-containing protein 12 n=1 Tax=Cricetulus griseus TaxID=10029 RepID=A0A061IC31_CRIGR|nr:F-box/WD repeat-containing protein 12 [Cricetulus griseus]